MNMSDSPKKIECIGVQGSMLRTRRPVGVAVSTTDSDSVDGGSIPSRAFLPFFLDALGLFASGRGEMAG